EPSSEKQFPPFLVVIPLFSRFPKRWPTRCIRGLRMQTPFEKTNQHCAAICRKTHRAPLADASSRKRRTNVGPLIGKPTQLHVTRWQEVSFRKAMVHAPAGIFAQAAINP